MHEYWFKPKAYGYGAMPVTWEGWALVALFVAIIAVASFALLGRERPGSYWMSWAVVLVVATVSLTVISWAKTDGDWQWRWGSENSRNVK